MSGAEMDGAKTTITLELQLAGDGFSGSARRDGGEAREFSGRLGLMQTIDGLLAGAAQTEAETDPPANDEIGDGR